jgi:hypothetical protein
MKPQTLATFDQLENVEWFTAVGVTDSQAVSVVSSWKEAIKNCSSVEWENLCLEAVNQYRDRIAELNPMRLAQWNELVEEIKKVSIPLVKRKIAEIATVHKLPKSFEDTVQWDILHLAIESEYSDIFSPGFYASQAYWYLKGHFPCGWDGDFPKGRLVVY